MTDEKLDRELGMGRTISRRDFLNGAAVGVGGLLASQSALAALAPAEFAAQTGAPQDAPFAPEQAADYYPPALTGMRKPRRHIYLCAPLARWRALGFRRRPAVNRRDL